MFCPKCGREIKDGDFFCMGCGSKFEPDEDEIINSNEVGTINLNEKNKVILSSKKKMSIIGGIIVLIGLAVFVFMVTTGSPVKNVSKTIYSNTITYVDYYKSDSFHDTFRNEYNGEVYMNSLNKELTDKKEVLLSKCKNNDEKVFVNEGYQIAISYIALYTAEILVDLSKALYPYEDTSELDEKVANLNSTVNERYKKLTTLNTVQDLNE